jgi:thiamine pyrophosphokinase
MSNKQSQIAFIFANGAPDDGAMVRRVLNAYDTPYIIVADGGAKNAAYYHLPIDAVIGDMDSIQPQQLSTLESQGVAIYRFPPEKNETDLELALLHAVEHGAKQIRIFSAIGGRFDQTLANVYLMVIPQLTDCDVAMVSGDQFLRVLSAGEHIIQGEVGDTISLIPMTNTVTGIETQALKYPLRHESLVLGPARGVSNVLESKSAEIRFDEGLLLLVHTLGRAE